MKSLKLPSPPNMKGVNITSEEMFFLDLTIMTDEIPASLYRRVFISTETPYTAARKASAIISSAEGRVYLERRQAQLQAWYYPEEGAVGSADSVKNKTIEDAINELQPTFIEELYRTMQNRNDPNFGDTMKLFLAKNLKDIQVDKTAEAPRRYLPESCNQCRYKIFVEQNCEEDNV